MIQEYKKVIIISSISVILLLLLLLFLFVDISLGPIKISSISTILQQHGKVTQEEAELLLKQSTYQTTLSSLEKSKKNYEKEKKEYEALSDETIKVIKEATMQEEYSIEYIWIRLGNYAKMNNLSIVLVEPGGTQEAAKAEKENQTTTTPAKTADSNGDTTTDSTSANSNENTDEKSETKEPSQEENLEQNSRGETFKIQVSGSYMNVSDFVFAVENDSELKFKLDNITMEYVAGTTIKATFDVKNMIIKK